MTHELAGSVPGRKVRIGVVKSIPTGFAKIRLTDIVAQYPDEATGVDRYNRECVR
jgi:hypothetical protein